MALFGAMRRRKMFERSAERFQCRIPGRLELCDSGVVLDGQLINLSTGGAMFRPALAYLLLRKSGEVLLRLGDQTIPAQIMATSPHGYGLRFDAALPESVLRQVLTQ